MSALIREYSFKNTSLNMFCCVHLWSILAHCTFKSGGACKYCQTEAEGEVKSRMQLSRRGRK